MPYSKRFNPSPSLVSFSGGIGRGVADVGKVLIGLGDDKIKRAKADALKKELEAKERAKLNATNAKNRVLAPEATRRLAAVYGIDEKSPLYKPGAPSKFNADLSLVDLGKESAPKKPSLKFLKENDKGEFLGIYEDGGITHLGEFAPKEKKKFIPPITGTVRVGDKVYITRYNPKTDKFENTGKLAAKQPPKPKLDKKVTTVLAKYIQERKAYKKGSPEYEAYTKRIKLLTEGKPLSPVDKYFSSLLEDEELTKTSEETKQVKKPAKTEDKSWFDKKWGEFFK